MGKIKISCVFPIPNDPTSFYRGLAPLVRLTQDNPNISLQFPQQIDWHTLMLSDMVYLQRPATPEHFDILCKAKDLALPVWVDFDDDNLAVPKENPVYQLYNQLHMKDAIIKLARHCDILSVSTKFLQKKYGIYNKNTVLIPNALDERLFHLRQIPPAPREKRVLWRGNATHQRNLMSVGHQLINVAQRNPGFKFTFFGLDPIDITDRIKNHEVVNNCGMIDYLKILCQLHPTVLYYPLSSSDHAQARSHISWLEGTFAGSAVLTSKNEEFSRPGCLNFSTPSEFETILDSILTGNVNIDPLVEESWAEIQDKYLLKHTNLLRHNVIETLLSKKK